MIQIKGYEIIKMIGKGGMSEVFLAHKDGDASKKPIAIKVMKGAFIQEGTFYERFAKEIDVVSSLDHPSIIKCYGSGKDGDYIYLAMEYLPSPDLKKRIKSGKLDIEHIAKWLREVATGLDYSHSKGFVHRDIKPENILLRKNESAVIADFGIVRSVNANQSMTGTGMSIGTPYYMSPEQARGRAVGYKSDIYSLGVMVFELLTGHVPYQSDDSLAIGIMHISNPVPTLPTKYGNWQPILNKMMAKKPAERYNSLFEFITDLDNLSRKNQLLGNDAIVEQTHTIEQHQKIKTVANHSVKEEYQTLTNRQNTQSFTRNDTQVPTRQNTLLPYHSNVNDAYSANNFVDTAPATSPFKKIVATLSIVALLLTGGFFANKEFGWFDSFLEPELTSQQKKKLQRHLQRAYEYTSKKRYFSPRTRNAYSQYNAALIIDPTNNKIWSGLYLMVKQHRNIKLRQKNRIVRLYQKYINSYPNSQAIKNNYSATLAIFIEQKFKEKKYIKPKNNNAMHYVANILRYDDNNSIAMSWLNKIQQITYRQAIALSKKSTSRASSLLMELINSGDNSAKTKKLLNSIRSNRQAKIPPASTNSRLKPKPVPVTSTPSARPTRPTPKPRTETPSARRPAPSQSNARVSPRNTSDYVNKIVKSMVYVHGGRFEMGNLNAENRSQFPKEWPIRRMTFKSFYIGKTEVTFAQYDFYAKARGISLPADRGWGRGNRPVINVSWSEAMAYIRWLNSVSGLKFRLPTEAEWEYAARAESKHQYTWGNSMRKNRAQCSNCGSRTLRKTVAVRSFAANRWGLYDMHGNVWEWTQDCWENNLSRKPRNGNKASKSGNCSKRVLKGGSWYDYADNLRVSNRQPNPTSSRSRYDGFRLALDK